MNEPLKSHPFRGVLAKLGVASDQPMNGARGRRVILPKEVAEVALSSLIGTPVSPYSDLKTNCGTIEKAEIKGNDLIVEGVLFESDSPEMKVLLSRSRLNKVRMGYIVVDVRIVQMNDGVWAIEKAAFKGAMILSRKDAAYRSTSCRLKD